jgi:hypothetical protein
MVRHRNIQSKKRLSSKSISRRGTRMIQQTPSSSISMVKHTPSENLDDETKLAKRHLTKEMWQLVSIAVKRMADELVSISNNQQATARTVNQDPRAPIMSNNHPATLTEMINIPVQQLPLSPSVQQSLIKGTGAGDIPFVSEKPSVLNEPIRKRTVPIRMLESSLHIKKKGMNNNETRRLIKSKRQNKSTKKHGKVTKQRLRNNK